MQYLLEVIFLVLMAHCGEALLPLLLMQLLLLVQFVRLKSVPLRHLARLPSRPWRYLRELLHVLQDAERFLRLNTILLAANNFIQIFDCAKLAQFIHFHFLWLRRRVLLL